MLILFSIRWTTPDIPRLETRVGCLGFLRFVSSWIPLKWSLSNPNVKSNINILLILNSPWCSIGFQRRWKLQWLELYLSRGGSMELLWPWAFQLNLEGDPAMRGLQDVGRVDYSFLSKLAMCFSIYVSLGNGEPWNSRLCQCVLGRLKRTWIWVNIVFYFSRWTSDCTKSYQCEQTDIQNGRQVSPCFTPRLILTRDAGGFASWLIQGGKSSQEKECDKLAHVHGTWWHMVAHLSLATPPCGLPTW